MLTMDDLRKIDMVDSIEAFKRLYGEGSELEAAAENARIISAAAELVGPAPPPPGPRKPRIRSSYLHPVFEPAKLIKVVERVCKLVEGMRPRPDTILVRGISGVSVGFPVSMMTGIPIGVVRKEDGSHSNYRYEGPSPIGGFVIVDDLVESGGTLQAIYERAKDVDCTTTCIGVVTYAQEPTHRTSNKARGITGCSFSNYVGFYAEDL